MATHRSRPGADHGAAAVEFALVLIPLLLVVYGIIDFGRAYNAQETLTQAARVGARKAVVGTPFSDVKTAVEDAAKPTITSLTDTDIDVIPVCGASDCSDLTNNCSGSATAIRVTANYSFEYLTPLFDNDITLEGTATAPC